MSEMLYWRPLSLCKLTIDQWYEIVSHSALPYAARPFIESEIDSYRVMASPLAPSAEIRKRLGNLSKRTSSLAKDLTELTSSPQARVALLRAVVSVPLNRLADEQVKIPETEISKVVECLDQLAKWLAKAQERVVKFRPGARQKSLAINLLVHGLDANLVRFTGRDISRSIKRGEIGLDYIRTVCKIADPTIGDSSIEEAMKRQIKARRGRIPAQKSG